MNYTLCDEKLNNKIEIGKKLRVIGFDDAPFNKSIDTRVNLAGVVCANSQFEGMLWGEVTRDGLDSTAAIFHLLKESKFLPQLDAILFDGIAFGGFNILDIHHISQSFNLPCITVMRRVPDFSKISNALKNLDDYDVRWSLIQQAGEVFENDPFYFQVAGISNNIAYKVLQKVTVKGKVPEPLRLAHLIGSAVKTGQSSNRA